MVMLTSAGATAKSPAMLGMAVVSTVPSRNSIKKVAATSRASRGCHSWRTVEAALLWGSLMAPGLDSFADPIGVPGAVPE
ncbi:hypothetical protein D9M72_426610 [compost metagenome]